MTIPLCTRSDFLFLFGLVIIGLSYLLRLFAVKVYVNYIHTTYARVFERVVRPWFGVGVVTSLLTAIRYVWGHWKALMVPKIKFPYLSYINISHSLNVTRYRRHEHVFHCVCETTNIHIPRANYMCAFLSVFGRKLCEDFNVSRSIVRLSDVTCNFCSCMNDKLVTTSEWVLFEANKTLLWMLLSRLFSLLILAK